MNLRKKFKRKRNTVLYLQFVSFLNNINPEDPIRLLLLQITHILRNLNDLKLRNLNPNPKTTTSPSDPIKSNPKRTQKQREIKVAIKNKKKKSHLFRRNQCLLLLDKVVNLSGDLLTDLALDEGYVLSTGH